MEVAMVLFLTIVSMKRVVSFGLAMSESMIALRKAGPCSDQLARIRGAAPVPSLLKSALAAATCNSTGAVNFKRPSKRPTSSSGSGAALSINCTAASRLSRS